MKKRLAPAKSPLPKFQSDQEAAEYFENHSVAGVWDQLPETPQAKPLAPEQITATKHIAAAKSVGYQTQLRMWIAEGVRREAKRT